LEFSNRRSTRTSGIALVLIEIEPSVLSAEKITPVDCSRDC
jgi:hypothetical protein